MQRYDYNISNIPNFHVQAWSTANYYLAEVLPVLRREGYVSMAYCFSSSLYVIYTFICALKTKGNSTYVSTVFWCRVIRVSPFANRLAMNIPPEIQFLRCLANYEALRFSSPILTFAHKLVSRMIKKSSGDDGKYVSIHLRFEEVLMLLHHLLPNYLFNLCDCVFLLPWHLISEL